MSRRDASRYRADLDVAGRYGRHGGESYPPAVLLQVPVCLDPLNGYHPRGQIAGLRLPKLTRHSSMRFVFLHSLVERDISSYFSQYAEHFQAFPTTPYVFLHRTPVEVMASHMPDGDRTT